MDKMLYVSMSGASQNTLAMRAHANNLANISTSGFRRDFEQARSMQVFGDSFPARVFAMSERPGTDFSHGSLQETGNELVRIAGLVRADDIATDNTVSSTRVADARITYSGTGAFADASQPGWLDRFFLSPLWPF